jgi:uncharacterized protein
MTNFKQAISRPVWAAAVALTLVASPAAFAADAPNIALAKQLLTVTNAMQVFTPLIPGVIEQSRLLYLQQNPGLGKDLTEIATKIRADLQPRLSELIDAMAKMYADAFTEQDMKEIITFYQSAAGKKLLAEQPKLVDSSMSFAGDWANKLSEEVTTKMREELIKRGHKL